MKEGVMGVVRYELEYNDDPADVRKPMFRQVIREGKEAYLLPIPRVKHRVHDAIAGAADIAVVKACVFYTLKKKGVTPNLERIKTNEEHFFEVIKYHQIEGESNEETIRRLSHEMDSMRQGSDPNIGLATFAYKFGMAEAYIALRGGLTGKNIPPLLSLHDYPDLNENERKILRISGLYTQWQGLAALPDSEFDSRQNPFEDPLLMIKNRTDSIISL